MTLKIERSLDIVVESLLSALDAVDEAISDDNVSYADEAWGVLLDSRLAISTAVTKAERAYGLQGK